MKRLGILDFPPEMIFHMLHMEELYPGAEFEGAVYDFDRRVFRLKISHPDLPDHGEGDLIPRIAATMRRNDDGTVSVVSRDVS